MRRLLPDPSGLPLEALYADVSFAQPHDRPATYVGMVSSLDGATTIDGVSGGLGGEGDLRAFRALRASADAVLVGAGTVRAEDYRGVRLPEEVRAARHAAGREEVPPIVIVTRSVDLDPRARVFHDTGRPPWLVVPGDTPGELTAPFEQVAEVVRIDGGDDVDLGAALGVLRQRGVDRLLIEGGPSLNAALFASHLVDEVFLTLTPSLVGEGSGIVGGAIGAPIHLELIELHEHDGELLLRLRVTAPPGA